MKKKIVVIILFSFIEWFYINTIIKSFDKMSKIELVWNTTMAVSILFFLIYDMCMLKRILIKHEVIGFIFLLIIIVKMVVEI